MFLILAFFSHSLSKEEKNLAPKKYVNQFRFDRNYDLLTAVIFIVSILPVFEVTVFQLVGHSIPLRVIVWIGALIFGFTRRIAYQLKKKITKF